MYQTPGSMNTFNLYVWESTNYSILREQITDCQHIHNFPMERILGTQMVGAIYIFIAASIYSICHNTIM
jgi:hypothetical protein